MKGWGRGSSNAERLTEDGHLIRAWKDEREFTGGNLGHSRQRRSRAKVLGQAPMQEGSTLKI